MNNSGKTEITVTAINLNKTSLDQILIGTSLSELLEEAKVITDPIETVTKLNGKLPITKVEKKIGKGNFNTPEITFKTLYGMRGKKRANKRC